MKTNKCRTIFRNAINFNSIKNSYLNPSDYQNTQYNKDSTNKIFFLIHNLAYAKVIEQSGLFIYVYVWIQYAIKMKYEIYIY